ncbi:MAG: bifunctional DNA primase/polymerase [Candidatus Hatepunaea meridiana]|nr:bifunctional DNA primase/polymerase [Candidatus Hatepunaea meridiana]
MSRSDMLDAALIYASFGWAVFPVHSISDGTCTCGNPKCTSPGKHPLTRHGFHDASTDPDMIRQWWKKYPWANIAIATGEKSGRLLVIDIDIKLGNGISGEETWQEVDKGYPSTVEVITGSGGRHLYFTYPEEIKLSSGQSKIGQSVDVRADGGYVIAPSSLHRSGRCYEWEASSDPTDGIAVASVPNWLIVLCNNSQSRAQVEVEDVILPLAKVLELRSALAFINADPYETWLKIGMALKSTHAGRQAYGIWTEWSIQSEKYEPRDQHRTWRNLSSDGGIGLSTLFWLAKQNGWIEPDGLSLTEKHKQVVRCPISEVTPEGLYNPPGIIGDITRFIVETAPYPQPPYAVNAALTLAGTILGRKVRAESGLRTNLYLVSIGTTASGKEHPRKMVKVILNTADLNEFNGGENLASGQALMTRLEMTSSVLFQLDEFGQLMQSLQLRNTARYNLEIMTNFIKLFSSADAIIVGTEYADQRLRPRSKIEYPCCSLHATTTPDSFYESITSKHIVSGYLNRFIVVDNSKAPRPPRRRLPNPPDVPAVILQWIRAVQLLRLGNGNLSGINPASPVIVNKTDIARKLLDQFEQDINEIINSCSEITTCDLWKRAWEHADKIALVCGCADNIHDPIVDEPHARWAIQFVSYHVEKLACEVLMRVADSPFEKMTNDFYQAILSAGTKGVTERDMNKKKPFRSFAPKDRRPAIETLINGGKIVLTKIKTAGRGRIAYVAIDNKDED